MTGERRSDKRKMLRLLACGTLKLKISFDEIVKGLIDLVLEAQAAAHLLRVEFGAGQIVHHLPVTFALPNLLEALLTDIADVEFLVFFVKQHATGCNQSGPRDLNQKGCTVTALIGARALRLNFAPLDRALIMVVRE